jgi:hypothetical protein
MARELAAGISAAVKLLETSINAAKAAAEIPRNALSSQRRCTSPNGLNINGA